jgi:hypothetical protein
MRQLPGEIVLLISNPTNVTGKPFGAVPYDADFAAPSFTEGGLRKGIHPRSDGESEFVGPDPTFHNVLLWAMSDGTAKRIETVDGRIPVPIKEGASQDE